MNATGGSPAVQASGRPVRVLRVISRLNVGGPAIQVITLARRLTERDYDTLLVRGTEGEDEGNMHHIAVAHDVVPYHLTSLQREIGLHDLRAIVELTRIIRSAKPDLMHTHAAKAGLVGRLAAILSGRARPKVAIHTFHGHVFDGVFTSAWKPRLFVWIERALARVTTRFVAVSEEVRDELVDYKIAPREQIDVVRLGFELGRFDLGADDREDARAAVRRELGIGQEAIVVTIVARVVQMKRVDRFLRVARRLATDDRLHFLIVGDGEQRDRLQSSDNAVALGQRLTWAGMRHDIPEISAASDIVVLTSDNEGTPVALIEAQASGRPVVGTRVGGVATVIKEGTTGFILERDDEEGIAARIAELADDAELRDRIGAAGRGHVQNTFTLDRLVDDIDQLYARELASARARGPGR